MKKAPIASDGLVARKSGAWAQHKLFYLDAYFDIFNSGMKKFWQRRVYIDLLAGPGRCFLERDPTVEFDGSPLLAFKRDPGFTRMLCCEGGEANAAALEARLAAARNIGRAIVRHANCNDAAIIAEARELLKEALGVIFVDTLGLTDPAFATIAAIVDNRKADLVITLQVHEFTRNARLAAGGDPAHADRFDRFFGTPAWRQRLADFDRRHTDAVDEADALTDLYCEQLETLGYGHCRRLHRLMKNSNNAPLYRLVFASRDDRGADFWDKITKRSPLPQQELGLGF